jgi:hypothetical protein
MWTRSAHRDAATSPDPPGIEGDPHNCAGRMMVPVRLGEGAGGVRPVDVSVLRLAGVVAFSGGDPDVG